MCGLYILTFWIPYPGITALKISRLLMMMPLATNTVYLSGMCLGVILQSYSGFSLKKKKKIPSPLGNIVYFHCVMHYPKDFRTIREMDIACSSTAKKVILIKGMSLFILFIEGWNVQPTSLTAFTSPSFKIMDKMQHFIEVGLIF